MGEDTGGGAGENRVPRVVMLNDVKHLAVVSARLSRATQNPLQPLIGAVTKKLTNSARRDPKLIFPLPANLLYETGRALRNSRKIE